MDGSSAASAELAPSLIEHTNTPRAAANNEQTTNHNDISAQAEERTRTVPKEMKKTS